MGFSPSYNFEQSYPLLPSLEQYESFLIFHLTPLLVEGLSILVDIDSCLFVSSKLPDSNQKQYPLVYHVILNLVVIQERPHHVVQLWLIIIHNLFIANQVIYCSTSQQSRKKYIVEHIYLLNNILVENSITLCLKKKQVHNSWVGLMVHLPLNSYEVQISLFIFNELNNLIYLIAFNLKAQRLHTLLLDKGIKHIKYHEYHQNRKRSNLFVSL